MSRPRSSAPNIARVRQSLIDWYRREARDLPWRRNRDPYGVWISEIMLQQTTVATVIPYYERFLARFPDLRSLAECRDEELLALWSGLGYYRRARSLRAAARLIVSRHDGRFPSDPADLLALPGIGPYTAGAIASICFGARAAAVDGNATRVVSRLYALRGEAQPAPVPDGTGGPDPCRHSRIPKGPIRSDRSAVWALAQQLVPGNDPGTWTQAVMELGAMVCRPTAPQCDVCPVRRDCKALAAGDPVGYPARVVRPGGQRVRAALVAVRRGRRILLLRRSEKELLGGLWELPGTLAAALARTARDRSDSRWSLSEPDPASRAADPLRSAGPLARALRASFGFTPRRLERIGVVRHTVTHRRLEIEAWRAEAPSPLPRALRAGLGTNHRWLDPSGIGNIPIGAASRKVLQVVGASVDRGIC